MIVASVTFVIDIGDEISRFAITSVDAQESVNEQKWNGYSNSDLNGNCSREDENDQTYENWYHNRKVTVRLRKRQAKEENSDTRILQTFNEETVSEKPTRTHEENQ